MFEKQIQKLKAITPLLDIINDPSLTAKAKFLAGRLMHPDLYAVLLGETSSGKSAIINSLIGRPLLPMKASPTTGVVTEVSFSDRSDVDFIGVDRDENKHRLNFDRFVQYCEHPNSEVGRLELCCPYASVKIDGLRVFDTPGYGSIVEEHEEVLKDFLPNSDIVVYVISYRIGIQENDFNFLRQLREIIRDDVKFILVINRCPDGIDENSHDVRLSEITQYAKDLLTYSPDIVCLPNITNTQDPHPIPDSNNLWKKIQAYSDDVKRNETLKNIFDGFIKDLFDECYAKISSMYNSARMSAQEIDEINDAQMELAQNIRQAVKGDVVPTFDNLIKQIPSDFSEVADNVESHLHDRIDEESNGRKDEMVSFLNTHLMPYYIRQEVGNVQDKYMCVISALNKRLDDLIQHEMIKFNDRLNIILNSNTEVAASSVIQNLAKQGTQNGLSSYFAAFGGAGGSGAGVANAASHGLKVFGNWFGKTFSRETHNALKHFISKVGFTSARALSVAAAALVEVLFELGDRLTWKSRLKKKVPKSLETWKNETIPSIRKDIEKLKETNVATVYEIARMYEADIVPPEQGQFQEIEDNMKIAEDIRTIIYQ